VIGVHSFWIDTSRAKQVRAPKLEPGFVAETVLQGVRDGANEVLLDDLTRSTRSALAGDIGAIRIENVFGPA
jgi:hypothetical protein